jgi:hypothetical protein
VGHFQKSVRGCTDETRGSSVALAVTGDVRPRQGWSGGGQGEGERQPGAHVCPLPQLHQVLVQLQAGEKEQDLASAPIQVSICVQLWRLPGCHEFLAALGRTKRPGLGVLDSTFPSRLLLLLASVG